MCKIVQCSISVFAAFAVVSCATLPEPAATGWADWQPVNARTGQITDIAGLEELAAAFPQSSSVRLRLLNAYADAGDEGGVFDATRWLVRHGYQFGPQVGQVLVGMVGEERRAETAFMLSNPPDPVLASEVFAEVPAEAKLVEGVAFDPASSNIGVTAVVSRELWWRADGQWKSRALEGQGNPSGIVIAADGVRIAMGNLGMLPADENGFAGLMIEGAHQPRLHLLPAPDGVNLSDITFGAHGTVFASDPLGGGIYRLDPGADEIEILIPPGTFRSPQGLAQSADERWLYVSDYRYGLAAIDLGTGAVHRLTTSLPILLDGIDALLRHGNELIAIQNGTRPMEIVALELGNDGLSITSHRILERDHPEWTEPLGATIHNGRLYYIANGQWGSFAEGGELAEGAELVPTIIRSLPLDPPPMAETP